MIIALTTLASSWDLRKEERSLLPKHQHSRAYTRNIVITLAASWTFGEITSINQYSRETAEENVDRILTFIEILGIGLTTVRQ